jgi:hypothetical protein
MAASRYYSNVAVPGTLGATISNSATSMYMTSTPTGYPVSFPFTLALDAGTGSFELVSVTSGAGTVGTPWVIVRAYDGTVASSHTVTTGTVAHYFSASDVYTSRLHEASGSGSGVHGLPVSAWASAAFAVIQETTLANSTTSLVTFSSIPATYSHLLIIANGRLTETTQQSDWVSLQINGDSGSDYSWLQLQCTNVTGSLVAPADQTTFATSSIPLFRFTAAEAGASVNVGGGFAIIPWYGSTVFNKCIQCVSGAGNGTSSLVDGNVIWGWWNPVSQAAISSLSLAAPSGAGSDFLQGTSFGLYGLS